MAVYTYTTEVVSPVLRISSPVNHLFGLVSYSYNQSSSDYIDGDDYGFISEIITQSEDFGSVSQTATLYDDYNYISTITNPSYGLINNIVSTTLITFNLGSVGGVQFALQGGSYEGFGSPYIGYGGLSRISGSLTKESFVPATEVGSGTLFNFISKEERRTYSYNGSSVITQTNEDFGIISVSHLDTENYGLITNFATGVNSEDYGLITTLDQRPYGLFKFVGNNSPLTRFRLRYIGSGLLSAFTGSGEAVAPFIPLKSGLFKFSGAATESTIPATVIGSGTLFNFITKEERRTYSYNGSAQIFKSDANYGFINEIHTDEEDYGLITNFATGVNSEDYGLITTLDQKPYGALRFAGDDSKTTRFRLRYFGSGSLFTFVSGTETAAVKPPVSGLFRFSGTLTEKNIPSYVGSGTLFNFITKEERRTYSYNEFSVVGEGLIDDYGIISEINFSSDDYGFVSESHSLPGESYGYISGQILPIKKPFGLFTINGAATQSSTPATHVGSGSLFTFLSGTETAAVKPPVSGLFRFSGSALEKKTPVFVGSGTLFNFITKEERRTYSYNGSSIILKVDADYRFINELHQDSEDYGNVSNNIINSSEDFGLITTSDQRPYGILRFAGDNAQTARFRLRYFGSGSLFTFVSGTETAAVKPPVSGLFRFSGSAAEATSPAVEIGSGTLFNFITKEERRTYSYNSSSEVITEVYDYGLIAENQQSLSDYGLIANQSYDAEDYGYITSGLDRRPYGRIRFSGSASDLQQVVSFVGSGSLISFTGSAERVRFAPETKVITRFRGSAAESTTPATEIGSGSLFTFVSGTETAAVKPPVSGLFRFSGAVSDLKISSAEVGSGSLFAFTGAAESVGVVPPVSGLLRFRSNTTEVYSKTNVVSGTLRSRSYAAIYDSEDKIRLVGAFESTASVPAIVGGPIKVQGEVGRIFFQYGERGEGRFTIAGEAIIKTNPIHFGGGFINIRGTSPEATVPAPHVGSGSIFAFVGSAESTTPAGEIGSTLFKFFGGISSVKETTREVGSGLIRVNVESSITPIWDYPVSGKLSVVGDSVDTLSKGYTGSGRLTVDGIAVDYFTNRFFSFGDPIRIRRTDTTHSTTRPFIASGSLFGFVSAVEATGANPPERILPIKLSGGATISRTESHSGSGSIVARHKSAIGGVTLDLTETTIAELANEIVGEYAEIPINAPKSLITGEEPKQSLVAAYESVTASPESKDRAIQIIGSRQRESFVPTNTGSGRLFGFGSSAESTTFVPAKTTELFKVVGTIKERKSVSNLGSGSLFGFGSSTEAFFAATPQEPSFVRITGAATQSFTPAPHIGSGIISTFVGSAESRTFSPDTKVLFEFTGSSSNSSTKDYNGSGTIFSFIGTAHAVAYDYAITQKAFRIFGATFESFGKSNYFGECQAQFVGASTDNKVNFESPKPIQIIMI